MTISLNRTSRRSSVDRRSLDSISSVAWVAALAVVAEGSGVAGEVLMAASESMKASEYSEAHL